jgi:hypothetical protein
MKKKTSRLALHCETVRFLVGRELGRAAGGTILANTVVCGTNLACSISCNATLCGCGRLSDSCGVLGCGHTYIC